MIVSGVLGMYTPNTKEALVTILAHRAPISAIAVDTSGAYMATVGLDSQLKCVNFLRSVFNVQIDIL